MNRSEKKDISFKLWLQNEHALNTFAYVCQSNQRQCFCFVWEKELIIHHKIYKSHISHRSKKLSSGEIQMKKIKFNIKSDRNRLNFLRFKFDFVHKTLCWFIFGIKKNFEISYKRMCVSFFFFLARKLFISSSAHRLKCHWMLFKSVMNWLTHKPG